jgi:RNA polymerase sigma-70 factor (ECF subfamily)
VQDAFERAMHEPRFLEDVRDPLAWFRTAVSRRAISRARRRSVLSRILPRLHEPQREYDESVADLRRALEALGAHQRAAVVLRYYADADYEEIARAIGVEASSVGPILTRARSKLREALQWHTTTAS